MSAENVKPPEKVIEDAVRDVGFMLGIAEDVAAEVMRALAVTGYCVVPVAVAEAGRAWTEDKRIYTLPYGQVPPWMETVGTWNDEGPGLPVMVESLSAPLRGYKRRGEVYRLRPLTDEAPTP